MKRLFGYLVEADHEATRKWYSQASVWGCSCGQGYIQRRPIGLYS